MDMTPTYWEENSNIQRVKYESCTSHDDTSRMKDERPVYNCCDTNLNFSTATCSEDDCEYGPYKKNKVARQDPMSHRIIEKRRRDRMNNCLADLSRLIPTEYLKKGRGRIEKTEIIEMAIKHMKYLQQEQGHSTEHYRLGYQECMSEAMRFMVEVEGHFPREPICVRLLNHLQKHGEAISRASTFDTNHHTSLLTEHIVPVPNINEPVSSDISAKVVSYSIPKVDPEPNNNNSSYIVSQTNQITTDPTEYEKHMDHQHPETHAISYKYKTNIKLRFNQDSNGVNQDPTKTQKMENGRRNSITSLENQSSSHSSPPSSEPYTRISDSDHGHRRSPSDSTSSVHIGPKLEPPRTDVIQRYSPNNKTPDTKNFNVPIFVLHAKGSYYIPLTIDYKTLVPFLQSYDLLEVVPLHILHPVTINVNFTPNINNDGTKYIVNNWH
ncbi:transcription factor cwo isoform X1 [Diorhabda sublineata]|uniref:transcription factor cwo isoform X1 n=2 Tax=Diorhabda sublineata TaxID=1163346 RepID=UPI0024E04368|nr:transcription factor cwo isoform X1 [Diorhabda sublineata]